MPSPASYRQADRILTERRDYLTALANNAAAEQKYQRELDAEIEAGTQRDIQRAPVMVAKLEAERQELTRQIVQQRERILAGDDSWETIQRRHREVNAELAYWREWAELAADLE